MLTVNIHETKTNLSKLLAMVENGQTITIAKAGHPIATLQPIAPVKPKRTLGSMKGKIWIADDFDDEIPEVTAAFEGKYDESWDELMGNGDNKPRKIIVRKNKRLKKLKKKGK